PNGLIVQFYLSTIFVAVGGDVPGRLEYYHKDHLGNVRLTFSDLDQDGAITVGSIYDPTNEIVLEKHYYPFGMDMTGAWFATVAPDNAYGYNGKELDEAMGLYDYGARYYDPAIARWGQVDPLAEIKPWVTPYNFVRNNPIDRIDPDGLHDYGVNKKTGEVTLLRETNDETDSVYKINGKGKIKGKAFDGVEKGILKEGQNFKEKDEVISVGGEGNPSLKGVEEFLTKMTDYVTGVEIAGLYLSDKDNPSVVTDVYIDEYEGNTDTSSGITPNNLHTNPNLQEKNLHTHFHTHPSNIGINRSSVTSPGPTDKSFARRVGNQFDNLLILTRTKGTPSDLVRVPYTKYKD
ncbi:MAG: RHS repeat-associated core domain-containing protein, partial [Bacteroidota bacterium]